MTDEPSLESKIAALSTKVDRESRFTRTVVVCCTTAIMAVILWTFTMVVTDMPKLLWATFQEGLEATHDHWMILDRTFAAKKAAAQAPTSK